MGVAVHGLLRRAHIVAIDARQPVGVRIGFDLKTLRLATKGVGLDFVASRTIRALGTIGLVVERMAVPARKALVNRVQLERCVPIVIEQQVAVLPSALLMADIAGMIQLSCVDVFMTALAGSRMSLVFLCPGVGMALLAGLAGVFVKGQRTGSLLCCGSLRGVGGGDRVAAGAVRGGVDSFQDEDLLVAKARRWVEGGLVVAIQTGLLRRPCVNVHMAGQAILRQAQERLRARDTLSVMIVTVRCQVPSGGIAVFVSGASSSRVSTCSLPWPFTAAISSTSTRKP